MVFGRIFGREKLAEWKGIAGVGGVGIFSLKIIIIILNCGWLNHSHVGKSGFWAELLSLRSITHY
jgi:hypothetical protein